MDLTTIIIVGVLGYFGFSLYKYLKNNDQL